MTDNTSSEEFDVSEISIIPSSYQVVPGSTFTAEVRLLPVVPISGAQFDVSFPQNRLSMVSIFEGEFFSREGVPTVFDINKEGNDLTSGTVYCAILGNRSVAEAGTLADMTMIAGNDTGYLTMALQNVILSDASSRPVRHMANNFTILVDSRPELINIGTVQFIEGKVKTFTLKATDADNDVLVFSSASLPAGASLDSSTGVVSWTPDAGQVGIHSVEFSVSDGYLTDTKTAVFEVLPSDASPKAYANGPYEVRTGKKLKFSSIGSYDPDGSIMSYTWDFGDGSTGVGPSPFHTYSKSGVYTVALTVRDNAGNTGTDITTVTVQNIFKFYMSQIL